MSHHQYTRRTFLKTTALTTAAASLGVPRFARGATRDKLNIAVVGVQNRGWANITQITSENIVALCDVDARYLAKSGEQFPDAKRYRDYREMLEAQDNIDAVLVATPDHIHAPASALAMRKGKHIYCEKPLTHTVHEARTLARMARERGLASQMGTQIHAGGNYRRVVELIQTGAIGPVREAHVWCNKSWSNGRFKFGADAPEYLDWDLWLGPTAKRPYSEGLHPANWRRFWDYGTGTLGDMACHYMDLAHWALDLMYPTKIWSEGPEVHDVGTPDSLIVHYEHPARDTMPPVKVTWYDGKNRPEILKTLTRADGSPLQWGDGQLFIGDEGMLISNYGQHVLLPEDRFADFKPPEPSIPDSIGHHQEWIKACKTGSPTTCNFTYSGALTEAVLLGNVAYRLGKSLDWDADTMTATNAPEAGKYIRQSYRDGWAL